jgi:hypothetical protein
VPGTPSGLSSSSTRAQIIQVYNDNACYYEINSTSYAQAFVTACIMLLQSTVSSSRSAAGSEVTIDLKLVQKQLDDAKAFLKANGIYPGSNAPRDINTSLESLR